MITVENLTKSFTTRTGTVTALDDVDLDIPESTLFGVVGPGGAGKSTLARCVALQDRPDRGAVRVDGTNLLALGGTQLRAARRRIGALSGEPSLLAQRSVAGNVALPLEQAGMDGPQRRARVAELLDLVGLTARAGQSLAEITPGQRLRVMVARALAIEPIVLVADDPTSGLSQQDTGAVLAALDRVRAELGITVVLTTQDPSVVRRVCDQVAVLEQGRLVEQGNLFELVSNVHSWTASAILPEAHGDLPGGTWAAMTARHDRVADVVLVGYASIGALLPEAASRFGVVITIIGGGQTRLGDTPVARFQVGVSGYRADSALAWLDERGGYVHRVPTGLRVVAA